MEQEKKVKDLMVPIEKFEKIDVNSPLCDVLFKLKEYYDQCKPHSETRFNKSVFVTEKNEIIGKLSMYHIIRALVPEKSKDTELKAINALLSSRIQKVTEEVRDIQERFDWLHKSYSELVRSEAAKSIRECMAPVHAVLKEDDTINWVIYSMFKLQVRELLVKRKNTIVGVINFTQLFDELMHIIGPDCETTLKDIHT